MGRRILVSSNCQTEGVAEALTLMLPGDYVTFEHIPPDSGSRTNCRYLDPLLAEGIDILVSSDLQCLEPAFSGRYKGLKVVPIPQILFPAFHPDIVYAVGPSGGFVRVLDADYHSALCLWGWKNRFDVGRTVDLFSQSTFHRVGYLNVWEDSVRELRKRFERCELDFLRFWHTVQRRSPFMYSLNHPKAFVLGELSKQVAVKLGAPESMYQEPFEELLSERLDALRWPIYPALGQLYGVPGSYRWKIRKTFFLSLEDYVEKAMQSYDSLGLGRDQLRVHTDGYGAFDSQLRLLTGEPS